MAFFHLLHVLAALCLTIHANPVEHEPTRTVHVDATAPPNCFPALGRAQKCYSNVHLMLCPSRFQDACQSSLEPDQLVVRLQHRICVYGVQLRGYCLYVRSLAPSLLRLMFT
jgi:hypothetical protein